MATPSIDAPARPAGFPAVAELAAALADNLGRVIRGKPEAIRLSVVALLSGHHLLLEDVPGVGKTLLAKALARSLGGSFRRIQATPDLLPSELTGVSVFHKQTEEWEFRPGPLFANVVLVDEINRATPRTQAALLEAMEERQITVDGRSWDLPAPFFVVATQNPIEHAGTFPLVEGQRDRFGLVVEIGLPHKVAERELLLGTGGTDSLDALRPVCTPAQLESVIETVRSIFCAPTVADYVIDLAAATRAHPEVLLGASPRASLSVLHAAKAHAALTNRHFVVPDDVQAVAVAALAHRLVLAGGGDLRVAAQLVRRLVETVPVPRG
ncbi:MAG TPA: AAA family ATPase [Acidimicrobiales bacterium]|nr:AAA family ATPase [Acidimicrobiales bacterium]